MAYIASSATSYGASATTATASIPPDLNSGDLMILICSIRSGLANTLNTPAGWTLVTTPGSAQTRTYVFWKIAGSSETDVALTASAAVTFTMLTHTVRDFNSTTPINTSAVATTSTANINVTLPAITPTANNCLVMYCVGTDTGSSFPSTNDIVWRTISNNGSGNVTTVMTGTVQQDTAATRASFTIPNFLNKLSQVVAVAINNGTSGSKDINVDAGFTNYKLWGGFDGASSTTFVAPNVGVSGLTSIAGANLSTVLATVSASFVLTPPINLYQTALTSNENTAGADIWVGGCHTLPASINISGKTLVQYFQLTGAGASPTLGTIMVLADASNNWRAYELLSRKNLVLNTQLVRHIVVDSSPIYASGGTIDLTAVTKVMYLTGRRLSATSAQAINVSRLAALDKFTISHGGVNKPINALSMQEAIYTASINTGYSSLQGSGQFFNRSSLQLGNGTNTSYIDFSSQAYELPTATNSTWAPEPNSFSLIIDPSANDTVNLSTCIFATSTRQNFIIDSTGAIPASYSFEGASLTGWDVQNNLNNFEFAGTTFKSAKITLNGGKLTNCNISAPSGSTAVTTNNPGKIAGCSFTSGGTGHGVEITATGTYNFFGNEFTGYGADGSTDAVIYNNSGGAVTLQLAAGDTSPTVRNGTGASTVINLPQALAQVTGIVSGSRIYVYNVTQAAEIDNAIVSGTSWSLSYDDGNEFTDGDIVEVRIVYNSGTTAKKPQKISAVATLSGWSALAAQENDTVYNTNAIDGSTVTEFTADYPNVQIDANDVDGETTVQRIYAWFSYIQMEADGVKYFFNGLTADDAVNYQIHVSVVDLKLDNTNSTTPLMVIGGRLYRDDGTTVIDAASNSIQLDPDKAYAVNVGGSALTPAEHDALIEIQGNAKLIPATL